MTTEIAQTPPQTHKRTKKHHTNAQTTSHKKGLCEGVETRFINAQSKKHKRTNMIEPLRKRRMRKIFVSCVAALFSAIHIFNSMRDRHYLTRSAILLPKLSPWRHLLCHGDDISFLELTGMSRSCFMLLYKEIVSEGGLVDRKC